MDEQEVTALWDFYFFLSLGSTSPPADAQTDPVDDGDESCKMSMSEKLALFNKLALPGKLGAGPADGPPERRRQKGARYRTQPITVEEVSMVSGRKMSRKNLFSEVLQLFVTVWFQLQKGPVQLPAFSLSAHLSDRQQVSSVNLKPSEVRLSQPRPGLTESQSSAADPCLKGILKKSRSAGSEWSRTDQNGGGGGDADMLGRMEGTERREGSAPSQRRKREGVELGSAAPWRQRVRTRRETIACTPMRAFSEQEGSPCGSPEQEETGSPAGLGLEQTRGAQ